MFKAIEMPDVFVLEARDAHGEWADRALLRAADAGRPEAAARPLLITSLAEESRPPAAALGGDDQH
jgi:hypothetical protein